MPGTPPTRPGPADWEYLIAHHFPGRYCRTLTVPVGARTLHFCARCTGELIGFVVVLVVFLVIPSFGAATSTPLAGVILGLCPSLAMADWLSQTVRSRESNNALRVTSGFLVGVAFAGLVGYAVSQRWLFFGLGVVVLSTYLAVAAFVLYRTGAWRKVVAEHFP